MATPGNRGEMPHPRLLVEHMGPVSLSGQPVHIPFQRILNQPLESFTVQFEIHPQEACWSSPRSWISSLKDRKGFGVSLSEGQIILLLFCGQAVSFGGNRVQAAFTKEARVDRWSRISVTLDGSGGREQQMACIYIDGLKVQDARVSSEYPYTPSDISEIRLGSIYSRNAECVIRKVRLLDCACDDAEAMAEEEARVAHLSVLSASLWESRCFTDCEVYTDDGNRWQVNRCILAVGSSVFARMLASGMQYSHSACSRITLQNAASADVEALLTYLYTGCLPSHHAEEKGSGWSALGVLTLADMYDVQGLLKAAVAKVEKCVSSDNVVETVRSLGKRKSLGAVEDAYRRVCQRVRQEDALHERIMDSL